MMISGRLTRGLAICLLSVASAVGAQQLTSPPPVASGINSPWDVRKILDDLVRDTEKLRPILGMLNPQDWADRKGASTVYNQQLQTAKTQLRDVLITSQQLAQKTESLSLALDDYFRMEALEVTTRSLEEAARRYADRGTADQLTTLIARNFTNREHFRDYIRDLASTQEQAFKLVDAEAQRCRGIISKDPAPAKRTRKY
jgi:hypothetical protein